MAHAKGCLLAATRKMGMLAWIAKKVRKE